MELLEKFTDTLSDAKEMFLDALSDGREHLCDYFNEETTVTRKTIATICIICGLVGVIYGFLIAPAKKRIQVNVNSNTNDYEED
ncbi:MAG: hypothetical protein K2J90_03645 [Lachnospiraceae bacterium]|nr:hypothetical protein [Lachnospiraceae bacterium]